MVLKLHAQREVIGKLVMASSKIIPTFCAFEVVFSMPPLPLAYSNMI